MGIVRTIELAAALVFAVPVAGFGVSQLLDGQTAVGAGLLVIAALMVVVPYRLTTPGDIPGIAAEKAAGSVLPEDED
jgi:hypothetical protein